MKKTRVLFVCLGNICRSPLAEAVFLNKLRERGLMDLFEADSCGTSNYHIGDPPDPRTIANARKNGITIHHRGRQLDNQDFYNFDYILAMDRSNLENIHRLPDSRNGHAKISLLREFDTESPGADVPDPYYGGEAGFQSVFEMIDRTMEQLITHLTDHHQNFQSARS